MNTDPTPKVSPLSQVVERNNWSVHIEIFEDGQGGWFLEITDGYGNSTVWNDSFSTDEAALKEAVKAIESEGIVSFVGPDSEMSYLFNI